MSVAVGSLVLNLLLLGAVGYAWRCNNSSQGAGQKPVRQLPADARRCRIAIVRTFQTRDFEQTTRGVIETLEQEANFKTDFKIFDGNNDRTILHSCIDEILKSEQYDLICVFASQAAQMVREATSRQKEPLPVVFVGTGDPVGIGLVDSIQRPGHNITGACMLGTGWVVQAAKLISVLMPHLKRVVVPYNPASLGGRIEIYREPLIAELEQQGIQVTSVQIDHTNEVMLKLAPFADSTDLVITLPDATVLEAIGALGKLGEQHQFGVYALMNYAKINEGASVVYGFPAYDSGRKAAGLIRRILENGEDPATMPVQGLDDVYRFAVNRQTAQAHGIYEKMNPMMLYLVERGELV